VDPSLRASLLAGAFAGLVGLVAFTLLHVLLVAPLWILLAVGLLPALLGGVFVGWAYHELVEAGKLPPRPLQGAAFGAVLWLTLVPLELVALAGGPPPAGVSPMEAMRGIGPGVLLPLLAGLLVGWALTRHARRSVALGLAALLLALPVAGTISALGGGAMGLTIFGGLLLVDVLAGLALAEARPRLAGTRDRRRTEA
jgi:hypothetical protein